MCPRAGMLLGKSQGICKDVVNVLVDAVYRSLTSELILVLVLVHTPISH